jgi:hypothetical protein
VIRTYWHLPRCAPRTVPRVLAPTPVIS